MATARQDIEKLRPGSALAAVGASEVEMNETWAGPLPDRFAFREIDFSLDAAGALQFAFTGHSRAMELPANGIGEVIDLLLNEPLESFNLFSGGAMLNMDTPLDVDLTGRPIYMIYRLRRPRNMKFNPGRKAMTHKAGADTPHYGGLVHVSATDQLPTPIDNCKLIYFVAAPPMPSGTAYEHEFNFNIWFDQARHPSGRARALEIQIDPDIRHPGGGSVIGDGP